jgi:hypothetical protein
VEVYGSNPEAGTITMKVAWRTLKISTKAGGNLIRKLLVQGRAVNPMTTLLFRLRPISRTIDSADQRLCRYAGFCAIRPVPQR